MTDRPIIFSAPMIRALLEGRKSQTRRVISTKGQANLFNGDWSDDYVLDPGNAAWRDQIVRYAPGDRLWVREACATWVGGHCDTAYRADETSDSWEDLRHDARLGFWKIRPSIHMPRWASRLTLTVTDVRVQRLRDISEADAVAEGVEPLHTGYFPYGITTFMTTFVGDREVPAQCCRTAQHSYEMLWNSLHGPDAWDRNPWVCALTFTVEKRNIDARTK